MTYNDKLVCSTDSDYRKSILSYGVIRIIKQYGIFIIKHGRCEEYEELLLRRDQLFRESGSYMTAYTQEFGDLITANYELKVECVKKRRPSATVAGGSTEDLRICIRIISTEKER